MNVNMSFGRKARREADEFLGHFKRLGDLDKLNIVSPRGFIEIRIGFLVLLYFVDGHTTDKRSGLAQVMRHYYETFKPKLTHYEDSLTSEVLPIRDSSFLDEYDRQALRPHVEPPEPKSVRDEDPNQFTPTLYGALEGERYDYPPPFHCCWGLPRSLNKWWSPLGTVSRFFAHIPASWVDVHGYGALRDLVRHWCGLLKPTHGTVGLGTLFDPTTGGQHNGAMLAFPLLKRFPGLEYNDLGSWTSETRVRKAGNRVIRGHNWLNIIDDGFVADLGGVDKMQASLNQHCPIHPYEGGVIIQAGPQAELGDRNRRLIPGSIPVPEHYCTVARLLKPLRFGAYHMSLLVPPPPFDGLTETFRWIARFD